MMAQRGRYIPAWVQQEPVVSAVAVDSRDIAEQEPVGLVDTAVIVPVGLVATVV